MKWQDIVGNIAPVLGTAFGGPLGAAAGLAVKAALSLPSDATDDEVSLALSSPDAQVKIKQAEYDFKTQQGAQQLQQSAQDIDLAKTVNATIQAEAKSEHWLQWAWRPIWGIIAAVAFGFVCAMTCFLAYKAVMLHDSAAMTMIPAFISSMTLLFGVPGAILGITAWGRNQLKIAQTNS